MATTVLLELVEEVPTINFFAAHTVVFDERAFMELFMYQADPW